VRRLHLAAVAAGLLLLPFGLRAANRLHAVPNLQPSYLPAIEGPRERKPFDSAPIDDLRRLNPAYIVIGDSMAGSRIDPALFSRLTKTPVAPILYAGSGPAWWYLALKNWVIPSGTHPRCVFIFFRDTNLTDVTFRIEATWAIDTAAHEREDDLNAAVARRKGDLFSRWGEDFEELYQAPEARRWLDPDVEQWPAVAMIPYRRQRAAFLDQLNDRLGLAHLRTMDAADMQATEDREADFDRFVNASVLPLMLREARTAGLRVCFVRVQRRPIDNRPPEQSPALRRYVSTLQAYIEQQGGLFVDDTGDSAETLDWYADGDHLSHDGRARYTELFVSRLPQRLP
jgi:hypothetical protein